MRLKIIHLNVRSWTNPQNNNITSNYFLQQNPDIITINAHSITRQEINVKLTNYSAITINKEIHAGVAILVKHEIPHTFHIDTLNKNIMATTIQTIHEKVTIISFYRPPRQHDLPLFDLNKFLQYNNPTLILADANVNHHHFGNPRTDANGKLLNKFMIRSNLHYLGPNFHTFYENNRKGKPDIILGNTDFLTLAHHITEGPRLTTTDHIPIIIELSSAPLLIKTTPKYNYNKANWDEFTSHMKNLTPPNIINKSTKEIDEEWDKLIKHIQHGAENYIPKTQYRLIPALTTSNRTRILQKIFNDRHQLYKHNMTAERIIVLNNIKRHIDSSKAKDLCHFWSKKWKNWKNINQQMTQKISINMLKT